MKKSIQQATPKSQFIIYKTEDGKTKIDVRFTGDTVWLTQQTMAELFQTSKQNISQHIINIFEEAELTKKSTVKNFLTVQKEGKREVLRDLLSDIHFLKCKDLYVFFNSHKYLPPLFPRIDSRTPLFVKFCIVNYRFI